MRTRRRPRRSAARMAIPHRDVRSAARRRGGRSVRLLLVLLMSCMVGCAARQAYPGAKRPDGEVAFVDGESKMLFMRNEYIRIVAIDGAQAVGEWRGGLHAEVLPGEHTFSVSRDTQYTSGGIFGTFANLDQGQLLVNLTFPVQAGHRYVIDFASDGSGAYLVSRSPIASAPSAGDQRVTCTPRKPFDYLHLVCPF